MKSFFPFSLLLLLVLQAMAQPGGQGSFSAILASELAAYKEMREGGIARLREGAKTQLLAVQKDQMKIGDLEAANAIGKAIESLAATTLEHTDAPGDLPPAAAAVLRDFSSKVSAGISGLNNQYIARLEKLKSDSLKAGDLSGANAVDAKIREFREEVAKMAATKTIPGAKPEAVEEFTVEALIDGNSELHVTKEGIFWVLSGSEAKPGLHEGANEATYVNDRRWKPKWHREGERGPDSSDAFAIKTTAPKLAAETLAVSTKRFGKNEPSTPVSSSIKGDHFVVTIRDPEGGSRWYKIRIKSVL